VRGLRPPERRRRPLFARPFHGRCLDDEYVPVAPKYLPRDTAEGSDGASTGEVIGRARDKVGETATQAQDKAGDLAGRAQNKAGDVGSRTQDRASQLGSQARQQASRASGGFQRMLNENPSPWVPWASGSARR
jgi:hypothetical protein